MIPVGKKGSRRVAGSGRELAERGFGLVEVVMALALFMVVVTPVAYLLSNSGGVTGTERARAIATDLAHQAADSLWAPGGTGAQTKTSEEVSGITFETTTSTVGTCQVVGPSKVPLGKETVTVSWGPGGPGHEVELVRWLPGVTGAGC